jgi:hypothetical protein
LPLRGWRQALETKKTKKTGVVNLNLRSENYFYPPTLPEALPCERRHGMVNVVGQCCFVIVNVAGMHDDFVVPALFPQAQGKRSSLSFVTTWPVAKVPSAKVQNCESG